MTPSSWKTDPPSPDGYHISQSPTLLGPIGTRRKPTKKKSVTIGIYLPIELMQELDAWRARQYAPPSRIGLIRAILSDFLEREKGGEK